MANPLPPETTPEWTADEAAATTNGAKAMMERMRKEMLSTSEIATMMDRLDRLYLAFERQSVEIRRLRSERQEQDAEIARLNEEIVECRRAPSPMPELNAVGEALVQMRTQFESAMEKADELEVGLDDAHSTIATMQRSIDGWREKAYQLERERAALEITAVSLRSELSRSRSGSQFVGCDETENDCTGCDGSGRLECGASVVRSEIPEPGTGKWYSQGYVDDLNARIAATQMANAAASVPNTGTALSVREMQAINARRSARWMAGSPGWTTLEIAGELAGEVGELANVCKKLRRSEMGVPGNKVSDEVLFQQARGEMADVMIVLMLTASKLGIDLQDAVCATFNAKSEQMGFPERL
jgi:NTP pyrophosphatase (non-canonical NTP hydrolase)/uncharacterized coiled-coil DUF342 family protein